MQSDTGPAAPWAGGLRELTPQEFTAGLDAMMDVYATAMSVPAFQLPGRRSIMASHAVHPAFRALVVTAPPDDPPLGGVGGRHRSAASSDPPRQVFAGQDAGPGGHQLGSGPGGHLAAGRHHRQAGGGRPGPVIAFSYGFRGASGQWWHDVVRSAMIATAGRQAADAWLEDSFEVAELHVRPEHQHRGIGRRLLATLTGGRAERTAVLSTMDSDSPARRLYRSAGFTDLLTNYRFTGADSAYAVMGASLPLLTG